MSQKELDKNLDICGGVSHNAHIMASQPENTPSKAHLAVKTTFNPAGMSQLTPPNPPEDDFDDSSLTHAEKYHDVAVYNHEAFPSPMLTPASGPRSMSRTSSQSSQATVSSLMSELYEPSVASSSKEPQASADNTITEAPVLFPRESPLLLQGHHLDILLEKIADGTVSDAATAARLSVKFSKLTPVSFVTFREPRFPEHNIVRFDQLLERMQSFLGFRIPGAEPENGRDTAFTTLWNTRSPWAEAKRLAFVGLLKPLAKEPVDLLLQVIRDSFFDGKPSALEWLPENSPLRARSGLSAPTRAKHTKSQVQRRFPKSKAAEPSPPVEQLSSRPVTRSTKELGATGNLPMVVDESQPPKTVSGTKRKFQEEEQDTTPEAEFSETENMGDMTTPSPTVGNPKTGSGSGSKSKSKAKGGSKRKSTKPTDANPNKRQRTQFTPEKKTGMSELFCRLIKGTFGARSMGQADYHAFQDAILPYNGPELTLSEYHLTEAERARAGPVKVLPDYGDPTGLHPREVALCKDILGVTFDVYRCQKARSFLGLALFVEYNDTKFRQDPRWRMWNVGKTQGQLFNNVDVNKISWMIGAFIQWGWMENTGKERPTSVPATYLARFPQTHRRKLMEEVSAHEIEWEPNPERRLATNLLASQV